MSTKVRSMQVVDSSADNTPIGATTPSTGAFTTLTATTPSPSDNSTNVATTAWSLLGFAISVGAKGYIKLPSWMGGLMFQWANGTVDAAPAGNTDNDFVAQTVAWLTAFPNNCFIAFASTSIVTPNVTSDLWYQTQGWNTGGVSVIRARSHNDAGRQGDYNSASQPFVWGIGN